MTMNLRQAIIAGVKNQSAQQLTDIIEDAINGEEQALPGIGVLFEMIWMNSDQISKQQMVQTLHNHLQSQQKVTTIT